MWCAHILQCPGVISYRYIPSRCLCLNKHSVILIVIAMFLIILVL